MTKIWTTLSNGRSGMRGTLCVPALIVLVALLGAAHILVRTSTCGTAFDNGAFNYLDLSRSRGRLMAFAWCVVMGESRQG